MKSEATDLAAMVEKARNLIRECDAVLISAGAGMGVDSGLPDFRGNEGFWKACQVAKERNLSFETLANPEWFESEPTLAWAFYGHRLNLYRTTVSHEGCKQYMHGRYLMEFKNMAVEPAKRWILLTSGFVISLILALVLTLPNKSILLALIAWVIGLIALPWIIKFTDWLRQYTMPNTIVTGGLLDTFSKKIFWSYGVYVYTMSMIYFILFFAIGVAFYEPEKHSLNETNQTKMVQ